MEGTIFIRGNQITELEEQIEEYKEFFTTFNKFLKPKKHE